MPGDILPLELMCQSDFWHSPFVLYYRYKELTPGGIIKRLVQHHFFSLAFRVCEYLELSPNSVLVHWACEKVYMTPGFSLECGDVCGGVGTGIFRDAGLRRSVWELAVQLS